MAGTRDLIVAADVENPLEPGAVADARRHLRTARTRAPPSTANCTWSARTLPASRATPRTRSQTLMLRQPGRLTPLAFPLWADRLRSRISSEDFEQRVERMLATLEPAR